MWFQKQVEDELYEIFGAIGMNEPRKTNWSKKFAPVLLVVLTVFTILGSIFYVFPGTRKYVPLAQEKSSNSTTTVQVINPQPPFILDYEKLSEDKQSDGLYKTSFLVLVLRQSGNFQNEPKIINGENLKNTSCTEPKWSQSGSASNNGRQIYELVRYTIECISDKPIIDNKNLFSLEYNYVKKEIPESFR